jgi:hypothetical protein
MMGFDPVEVLLKWFKATFRERTQRRDESIHWALPETRINSHEVIEKAKQLGIPEANDGLLFRGWFQDIYERRLRKRCTTILIEEGDAKRLPKLTAASRASLAQYRASK